MPLPRQLKIRPFKAFIVGDVMLDVHHFGEIERRSEEAPVDILDVSRTFSNPGGAANVAMNIRSMGGLPLLMGVTGKDDTASQLFEHLQKADISTEYLVQLPHIPTSQKSRFYSGGRQVFRADRETTRSLAVDVARQQFVKKAVDVIYNVRPEIIILQDYNKGVLHPEVITAIVQQARFKRIPVIVDPKFEHLMLYKGVYLLKPNLKEWRQLTGMQGAATLESMDALAADYMKRMNLEVLLVTLSENGVYYNNQESSGMIPGLKVPDADVSGAGDSVISGIAMAMSQGWSLETIAAISNLAGAAACIKKGVQPVSLGDIRELMIRQQAG